MTSEQIKQIQQLSIEDARVSLQNALEVVQEKFLQVSEAGLYPTGLQEELSEIEELVEYNDLRIAQKVEDAVEVLRGGPGQDDKAIFQSTKELLQDDTSVILKAIAFNEGHLDQVRGRALRMLMEAESKPEMMIQDLINIQSSGPWLVRNNAAVLLGNLKATEAIPTLINSLEDQDYGVRQTAVQALGNIAHPSPEVITALTRSLDDAYSSVRYHAAHALGVLGAAAESALPKLVEMSRVEGPNIRYVVNEAKKLIEEDLRANISRTISNSNAGEQK